MKSSDRHMIIPAVWMILKNADNEVFLLRRAHTGWKDGWYTVPAGHVDAGEGPSQAAIRELKEEAGVDVKLADLGEPLIYFYPADDRIHERVSIFFVVGAYEGTPHNVEPHKADEGVWAPIDNLPDNTIPMLKRAVIDIANGVHYSERYYDPELHTELLA